MKTLSFSVGTPLVAALRRWLGQRGLRKPPRLLNPFAAKGNPTLELRPRRLNYLLSLCGRGERYLEIGLFSGKTFEAVNAKEKVGVDPKPRFWRLPVPSGIRVWKSTSKEFFENYDGQFFDLILLDGLHEAWETYCDLVASLRFLNPGGGIMIDDVLPSDLPSALPNPDESRQGKEREGITHHRWYGDVWKLGALLVERYPTLHPVIVGNGVGPGGNDHGQMFLGPIDNPKAVAFDAASDFEFMEKAVFENYLGPSGVLSKMSSPEKSALSQIGQTQHRKE